MFDSIGAAYRRWDTDRQARKAEAEAHERIRAEAKAAEEARRAEARRIEIEETNARMHAEWLAKKLREDEAEAARKAAEEAAWRASPQGAYITRLHDTLVALDAEYERISERITTRVTTRAEIEMAISEFKRLVVDTKARRQEFAPSFSTYLSREGVADVRNKFNDIIAKANEGASSLRAMRSEFPDEGQHQFKNRSRPAAASAPTGRAILTSEEFNALLKVVHPDRQKAASDAERGEAVKILIAHKAKLLGLNS
jgi:hypothetical protein